MQCRRVRRCAEPTISCQAWTVFDDGCWSSCVCAAPLAWALDAPVVAAAADLKFALKEVAALFRSGGEGANVRLTFGSSGNFARRRSSRVLRSRCSYQPTRSFVKRLANQGLPHRGRRNALCRGAGGRAVRTAWLAVACRGGIVRPQGGAAGGAGSSGSPSQILNMRLTDGRPRRRWGHAGTVGGGSRLVLGENAAQAAQFATRGSAQGGIFALFARARAGDARKARDLRADPREWHEPLRQRMVLSRKGPAKPRGRSTPICRSQPRARCSPATGSSCRARPGPSRWTGRRSGCHCGSRVDHASVLLPLRHRRSAACSP